MPYRIDLHLIVGTDQIKDSQDQSPRDVSSQKEYEIVAGVVLHEPQDSQKSQCRSKARANSSQTHKGKVL